MRAKSQERLEAERLRREDGLSYKEISERTGLSKSTLSHWLRDIGLHPEHEARLAERLRANRAGLAARAWPVNRKRYTQAREDAYQGGVAVVSLLPNSSAVKELALAMLYLGEGSKSGNRVQMASTDPSILRYFVEVLTVVYQIDPNRLSFRLNLIELARPLEQQLQSFWCQQMDCPPGQFLKAQFNRRSGASTITADYHGVCTVTYHDTYLQQRLLGLANTYIGIQSTPPRTETKKEATVGEL
jgi:transcriptional regulator with XRE-family HTH domain